MSLRSPLAAFSLLVAFGACSSDADETIDEAQSNAAIELSPTLCDDPGNLQRVLDALGTDDLSEVNFGLGGTDVAELQKLLANPTEPFYMVNLIKFRERAEYPDGRDTDLTGREANSIYDPLPFIDAIGGRVVYSAEVDQQFSGGDDVVWESVAIVEYSCPIAMLAMSQDPGFKETIIHKDAGVEVTRVMPSSLREMAMPVEPDSSQATFPPTEADPAFDFVRVVRFRDKAQYEAGASEPERTGEEAWNLYASREADAIGALGHDPIAVFDVRATLVGESVGWDQVHIIRMSSQAGYDALQEDDDREGAAYHREAALVDVDEVKAFALFSTLTESEGGGGLAPPEVTENGTGTTCATDADCPDASMVCITDGSSAGFCSPEGCESGTCQGTYTCCRDCNPALADQLPFEGSACFPGALVSNLTGPPVSCTCD
ncbi:MAG: hypothetical protein AAF715_18820 [Myxococcota bacterium]